MRSGTNPYSPSLLTVHLWDLSGCPSTHREPFPEKLDPPQLLRILESPCQSLDFGVRGLAIDNGHTVVAAGDDGIVHVWRLSELGRSDWAGPVY